MFEGFGINYKINLCWCVPAHRQREEAYDESQCSWQNQKHYNVQLYRSQVCDLSFYMNQSFNRNSSNYLNSRKRNKMFVVGLCVYPLFLLNKSTAPVFKFFFNLRWVFYQTCYSIVLPLPSGDNQSDRGRDIEKNSDFEF